VDETFTTGWATMIRQLNRFLRSAPFARWIKDRRKFLSRIEFNQLPLKILIEKVPFLEYLTRLALYLWDPDIKNTPIERNPLRFAPADVFLSFGFIVAVTTFLALFKNNFAYLQVASAVNVEPLLLSYVLYAVGFSLGFPLLALSLAQLKDRKSFNALKNSYYLLVLHCMRFFAVIVLVSYASFIHAAGLLFNDGISLIAHSSVHPLGYWFVCILMAFLLFRLFLNPVSRYIRLVRRPFMEKAIWLGLFVVVLKLNAFWPVFDYGAVLNEQRCRELLPKTALMARIPKEKAGEAEERICNPD